MTNSSHFELIREEALHIGCPLTTEVCQQFEVYLQELVKWNQKINLTGHKKEKDIIANLFIDSLALHKVLNHNFSGSILDIGTGAGFPGVPLKIFNPKISVTLVEPNLKKVSFLHHIIGTLNLKHVSVEAKRIEEVQVVTPFHKGFDWIFLKALRYDVCLPYVRPLLGENGKVVLSRSQKQDVSPELMGFTTQDEIFYQLPFGFGERVFTMMTPKST